MGIHDPFTNFLIVISREWVVFFMHNQREHLKLRLVSLHIWQCLYDTLHRDTHAAVMSSLESNTTVLKPLLFLILFRPFLAPRHQPLSTRTLPLPIYTYSQTH